MRQSRSLTVCPSHLVLRLTVFLSACRARERVVLVHYLQVTEVRANSKLLPVWSWDSTLRHHLPSLGWFMSLQRRLYQVPTTNYRDDVRSFLKATWQLKTL